jgi:hypothetical protein
MGCYCHLSVIFACDDNDGVAALARGHLESLAADAPDECRWFLGELGRRSGPNPGPKGGLSLWGMVGNHSDAEGFVEHLRPFWADLLSEEIEGGPCNHEHVLVFYEMEESEHANAFEIARVDDDTLTITHHADLPFAWMQF